MNKKLMIFGIIGLFAMALVGAGLLVYYGQVNQNIDVNQPIDFTSTNTLIPCDAGETCDGDLMTIENDGQHEVDILISDTSPEGVITSYFGTLELTKKTVDFGLEVWEIPELSDKVQIEYTVVGSEFNAKVTEDLQNEDGYVLVYYADNDNRFANPGQAVLVGDVSGNLPGVDDENADLNDYSAEYPTTPFGAKIWYVPSDAIPGGVIDWSRADEFYFESSLIQYNSAGQITVYPGELLDVTPRYALDSLLSEGSYWVTTEVLPA